jgi:hypothetical protein
MVSAASLIPETDQTETASKRAELRKRCFMGATISYNKGLTTCECVIRNISESGARLDLPSRVPLPEFFHLYIPAQGKRLYVELKWRSENEAGIQFRDEGLTPTADQTVQDDAALKRRIRELEAEVVRLQGRTMQLTEG